jgi:hypothetical protein
MSDIIRRFVEVNTIAPTTKHDPDDLAVTVTDSSGKFIYTLNFTLKFLGGVKPSFEIARLDGRQLKGNADLNGSRLDTHNLIIALAPPSPKEVEDARRGRTTKSKGPLRARSPVRADRHQNLTSQIQLQQYLQRLPLLPLPLR